MPNVPPLAQLIAGLFAKPREVAPVAPPALAPEPPAVLPPTNAETPPLAPRSTPWWRPAC